MSEFIRKLAETALNSEGYIHSSNELFRSYVKKMTGDSYDTDGSDVRKLASIVQYLYQLSDRNFREEGNAVLSMLLEVCGNQHPEVVGIARRIFSDSGDFPNINLINRTFPKFEFKYSFLTEAEMEFKSELNSVKELDFSLTDFQRLLWEDLTTEQDVLTVAPTSAGKTHVILSYLVNTILRSDGAFAAVIVPTRALITEVANKLHEITSAYGSAEKIEICTVPKEEAYGDKTVFVMTQERLFEVLQRGDVSFNYLFIDEAHNISDNSRGVLLHLTIEKLLEDSFPQVIVSMPSPSYQNSFSSVLESISLKKQITSLSPVAKIIMEVSPVGRDLRIQRHNSDNELFLKKGFKGKSFEDIVLKLGNESSNLIYRNRTSDCEGFAKSISAKIEDFQVTQSLEEAASYVEKFIHSQFSLASCLRKGVAFHYGPLPSSLRVMIENLVKDDEIKYVACTSTLAEGVNLPAKNLFLKNPLRTVRGKPSEQLEDVKIKNITGRAGRMMEHFTGNIFIVDPDEWQFDDYFDDKGEDEDQVPTYFKSLNDELADVLLALRGLYPHTENEQYKFYSIANKLLKEQSEGRLEKTLEAEELKLDENDRKTLYQSIEQAYQDLVVPSLTLSASPTTGYIQQNKLFVFLRDLHHLDEWTLPHPKSGNLYDNLLKITEKLHELGVYTPTGEYTVSYICLIASKWVRGDSLKSIISEQIGWLSDNDSGKPNPDKAVREVIKVINNDVRFRLSNALKCYHLLLSNLLTLKSPEIKSTKLHSYIEVGSCDDRVISLINLGLSREAAGEIVSILPRDIEIKSRTTLMNLQSVGFLNGLHPVTEKEINSILV